MTVRTFEHVTVKQPQRQTSGVILKALREKLDQAGVKMEIKS